VYSLIERYSQTFLITCLCMLTMACADSGPDRPESLSFRESLEWEIERNNLPSLSVVIVKDSEIVYSQAFGLANQTQAIPATPQTPYILGSVTKTFTATAVMQLVEQNLIDIDADINTYLPFSLRNPNHPNVPITTRMILTHSSSLARNGKSNGINIWAHYADNDVPMLATWIADYFQPGGAYYSGDVWTKDQPGQLTLYSNTAVTLLGYLVEVVSGEEFRDYCQAHIFQPLEMGDTGFRTAELITDPAVPYDDNGQPMGYFSLRLFPAGFLYSSAEDSSRFMRAIMNGGSLNGQRIIKTETVELMLHRQSGSNIGLIWFHTEGWVGHNGGYQGVAAYLDFDRTDGIGAVILTNTHSEEVNQADGAIYRLVHEEVEKYR